MLKRLLLPAALVALALNVDVATTSMAASQEAGADTVGKIRSFSLFKNLNITSVAPGPIPGLYEVVIDNKTIVYASLEKELVLAGQIYRADGTSLSKDRLKEVMAAKAKDIAKSIDKSKAIKIGSGPVEVFEFTDVDCPYCRKSESYFADKAVYFTRYVILTPLDNLHPDSKKKTMYILNSSNPVESYQKAIAGDFDKQVPEYKESAQSQQTFHYFTDLNQKLGFKGTPTFVWSEGIHQGLDQKGFDAVVAKQKDAKTEAK